MILVIADDVDAVKELCNFLIGLVLVSLMLHMHETLSSNYLRQKRQDGPIIKQCMVCIFHHYPARRACPLRALGLLLADGGPTVGRGKTF